MDNRNFMNSNEVFPIIDIVRREMQKQGLYGGGSDNTMFVDKDKQEPNVVSVEALRELPNYKALVTKVIYTYDNGMTEKLTIQRDLQLIVSGFLIEIEHPSLVNTQLEVETDIASFSTVRGTIVREGGLFKNLLLEYTKAV